MKKISLMILSLFFINLLAVQTVKAQEDAKVRKMMVGVWKIHELESPEMKKDQMSAEEKVMMEDMVKEMKEKSFFKFMEDGNFGVKISSSLGSEHHETGDWKLEGGYLVTTNTEGGISKQKIFKKNKNMIILGEPGAQLTLVKVE